MDRQNEIIADEFLCELTESINTNDSVMRMGLNHDISIMPVGKVITSSVVDLPDNSIGVEAQIDDFICDFNKIEGPDKQILYRGESVIDKMLLILLMMHWFYNMIFVMENRFRLL